MKIKNLLLVNFIFCFCCHLYGQHEVNLGSTTVFSSTYIHSSKRLSGSNGEHQIEEIKFSDTLTIRYIVNKVENDESATRVYGVLQSPLKGGIFLVKKGTEIEGDVFIASWNKVLRFETRFSQVYLKEEILEKIICVEKESDKPEIESNAGLHSNGTNLKTSNVDTRKLQSYPGAKAVVYIDFDGGMSGQRWANSYNNGIPFYLPPANMSSENEYTVWQVMSEDFKPFDINITTDSTVFHQYPTNRRQRIIVTRYSSWNSLSTTGIAYVNGFSTGDDPCFSFPSGFSSSNVLSAAAAERLGEVSSHEVGHTLGLSHDGSSTTSYYSGHGNWAPIMGSGYYKTVTQWSKGEYAYANQLQDDLAIITKVDNGFGYKADDHANNYASSTALNITSNGIVNASVNNGVIETNTDIDVFHFTTTGGNISLHFGTALPKPNLDILAKLYNSNNQLITSSDVPNATYADINTSLSEGSYYITIEGVGYGSPLNTGYSKYASLGYYEISGTIPISGTGNQLPTVSITAPGSGATYTAPASFTITATASDPDGSISKVEFYNGTTLLGTDNTSPYSYAWSGVVAGTYTLTAKAYDNSGAISTSSSVTITVTSGTFSCTAPAWNATTIYLGDAGLGTGKGEVVSYNNREYRAKWWTQNNTPGTNSVWLDLGACSSQNQLPSVSITAPDNGATYTAPAGFTITATASDPDGSISKVEFYNGTTLLGTDNTSPYSYAWSNVSAGTYSLTAKAYDNSGGVQTSSVVSVTVNAKVNQLPSVSITAPDNGATYTAPASFTITATASDPDGSISKVEFYNGTTLLGTDNTSPYSYAWSNVSAGTYSLTAKAYDNSGGVQTSSVVSVTVTTSSTGTENCSSIAAWNSNSIYVKDDLATYNGFKYKAKWWTKGNNPATNSGPYDVWLKIAECMPGTLGGTTTNLFIEPSEEVVLSVGEWLNMNVGATDNGLVLQAIYKIYQDTVIHGVIVKEAPDLSATWSSHEMGTYLLQVITKDENGVLIYSDARTVNVSQPTSLLSTNYSSSVQVIPNPNSGRFYITVPGNLSLKGAKVEITTLSGQKIYETVMQSEKEEIAPEQLNAGMYMMKVTTVERVLLTRVQIY